MSIRWKLVFIVLAASCLPVFTTAVLSYYFERDIVVEQVAERLNERLELGRGAISKSLALHAEEIDLLVSTIDAERLSPNRIDSVAVSELQEQLRESIRLLSGVDGWIIMRDNDEVVAGWHQELPFSELPLARQEQPELLLHQDRWMLGLRRTIPDLGTSAPGIIHFWLDPTTVLATPLRLPTLEKGGEFALLTRASPHEVRLVTKQHLTSGQYLPHLPISKLKLENVKSFYQESGIHRLKGTNGGSFMGVAPIPGSTLMLVVEEGATRSFGTASRLGSTVFALGALSVIAAFLFIWFFARRLLERIGKLATVATAINEGDIEQKADFSGRDELSQFADAFDSMTQKLLHSQAELERRVEERTAEIKKLAMVASRTDNSIILTDENGVIEWVNDAFTRTTGYTLEDVRGERPGKRLQGPGTDPKTVEYMRDCLQRNEGFQVEILNYTKIGRAFWNQIEVQPLFDESGNLTHYMSVESDITARKQADEALRESEKRFRSMADTAPVYIWMAGPDRLLTYVSKRWLEFTGRQLSDELGNGWLERVHPDDLHSVLEVFYRAYGERRQFSFDFRIQREDGEYRWFTNLGHPRFHADGTFLGYLGTCVDITERYVIERRTRLQAERLRILYEIASKPNLTTDLQIRETLKEVCRVLDVDTGIVSRIEVGRYTVEYAYSRTEPVQEGAQFSLGHTYCSLMLSLGMPLAISKMTESSWKGHPCFDYFGLETYVGAPLYVGGRIYGTVNFSKKEARTEPFEEIDKDFVQLVSGWIGSIFERAKSDEALKEAVAELDRSNQELDEFAYIASHDLRAPLRSIQNLASWIREDALQLLPPDSQNDLLLLEGRAKRMEKLLEDLLEYSRVGRVEERAESFSSRELVEDVVQLIDVPDGFEVVVSPELPAIRFPKPALEKVFRNLISNALKHHDRDTGRVEVSAREKDEETIVFSIRDDGPGIPLEYHEQVFQLFKTLKPRDEVEGSGMGLATVKKTVELLGGRIWIEPSEGRGTELCIALRRLPVDLSHPSVEVPSLGELQ